MGSIGDAYDNAMAESFFSVLQRELLDEQRWTTRRQLALAVFEWIEAWYNPHRRHTSIGSLSPIDYEAAQPPIGSRTQHEPEPLAKPGAQLPSEARNHRGWYQYTRRSEPLRTVPDPTPEPSGKPGDGQGTVRSAV